MNTKLKTRFAVITAAGLLLGLFQFIINHFQAHWIIFYRNNEYGLKGVKTKIFVMFHNTSVEVSTIAATAVFLMLTIGASGLAWIIWREVKTPLGKQE